MYKYSSLSANNQDVPVLTLSDNMSVNGVPLNELVEGYRHLTVTGRGIVSQDVKTTNISGRRGVWIDEVSDSERELEIKYRLEADSSAELRDRFAKLNSILRTVSSSGFLEITFKDEPDYVYYALFKDGDSFEEVDLTIISKFSLLVPDGYKKKAVQESTGYITLSEASEVLPEAIVVTPTGIVNNIRIINGDKTLSFNGNYSPDHDLIITFGHDEVTATFGGRNILADLERFSPLENFTVKNRNTILATNAEIKRITWRDERL